ncbi:unnamed protein product, partial [Mesorhabditis belari]|uniref:Cadherin domain-containing protein n=1 Tax=Mesorhabditis belari TaxID=2138241 RepID=A0AAF3E9A1_9BILA
MLRLSLFLLVAVVVLSISEVKSQQPSNDSAEPSLLPPLAFSVPESAPIGHHIGYVEGSPQSGTDSRYFIVSTDPDKTDTAIHIDERTGEITVGAGLDYETQRRFELVAIPIGGEAGIPVTVNVEDENDNEPTFTQSDVRLEISEFVRIGAEFPLPSAVDRDGPPLDVRTYKIIQGNVNNVFKLSTKRVNNVLYADLMVNGRLDREYRESYELLVEASDGGNPPRTGELHVSILILDANDNAPEFSEKIYHAMIDANHPVEKKPILEVKALDKDSAHNGQVSFRIAQPASSVGRLFSLSSNGVLTRRLKTTLPSGTFEFPVIASDHGMPPQESSVVVSVTVEGGSSRAPSLDVLWLTDHTEPRLLENATLGSIVARVNVTNYDQQHGGLELSGCTSLCLQQSQHPFVYLLIICGLLDRETTSTYHLKFVLKKGKDVILEHPVVLTIEDVNDNSPQWTNKNYHLILNRTLSFTDVDAGNNGRLHYWIEGTDVIGIDEDTGRIHYATELDCSIGSELRFRVHASDRGNPPLSGNIQITADIVDSAGKAPQFERALYTERIREDVEVGTCVLKMVVDY